MQCFWQMPDGDNEASHYLECELNTLVQTDPAIFQFLQAGSLDGIWYWDLERPEHEWMSARFWETFGHAPGDHEHLAAEWQDMINPDDLKLALENFGAHAADGSVPYDQTVRYRHRDGSTVWVRCRGLAIRDENGKPVRMLGAHQDVTDLKRVEEELVRKNRELEAVNRDLAELAYATSHDVKAPLRSLSTLLEMLHEDTQGTLSVESGETLAMALGAAARLEKVVAGIIGFAALTGKVPASERFDASEVVRGIADDFSAAVADAGAEIRVGPLPVVTASLPVFRQILANLVGNALKFRREDASSHEVVVDAEAVAGGVRFSVQDNGIGIAAEHHARIFGAFKRLHRTAEFEGNGLGLAMCRRGAALLGGRIWVESEVGVGSTFFLELPQAERKDAQAD